jgi:hypothetical protein
MKIIDHPLGIEVSNNLLASFESFGRPSEIWIKPEDLDNDLTSKLYPSQIYDYQVNFRVEKVIGVINKLEEIIDMSSRSIYLRKQEDKSELVNKWSLYNYEFYTLIFQSMPDVCAMLLNYLFRLGIPDDKCYPKTTSDKLKAKAPEIINKLDEILAIISNHRNNKNQLLHRGIALNRHPGTQKSLEDFTDYQIKLIAEDLRRDQASTKKLLKEFLSIIGKKNLLPIMKNECIDLEQKIIQLFDMLLPYYHNNHIIYAK